MIQVIDLTKDKNNQLVDEWDSFEDAEHSIEELNAMDKANGTYSKDRYDITVD